MRFVAKISVGLFVLVASIAFAPAIKADPIVIQTNVLPTNVDGSGNGDTHGFLKADSRSRTPARYRNRRRSVCWDLAWRAWRQNSGNGENHSRCNRRQTEKLLNRHADYLLA